MTFSISSPTAPSTSSSPWVYEVFLSFRGEDTRNAFTAHLYAALVRKGLYTYIDELLTRGDQISPALLQAIECSRISIIILSEDYASSTWCLYELVKILQCKKSKQQRVLPIFYHVDPSDVRHQRKSFKKALAENAEKLNGDMNLQMCKEALREVANLSGYHLRNGNESEFIEQIVQGVSRMANDHLYLHVAKHPVGLKPHVEAFNWRLNVGKNDIRIVGILGVSGSGKTTLAKAIYNSIAFQFEASCFLLDVGNISKKANGLVRLQKKLLSKIFRDCQSLKVGNSDAGINIIKHRLRSKRVLLILDGVDDRKQLDKLAGARDWFGKGSRILITTTDQHLLTTHEVDSTYKMTGLNHDHAIQLFCWHAFNKEKPVDGYENLVEQILDYAESLPLVLTILGEDLRGRSQREWICALDQYKKIPHQKLQDKLRPIYDQLSHENEKNIFLDIACFFTGDVFDDVITRLDSFGFFPEVWIPRLEQKCLISNFHGQLYMHDVLRDIGREVVRQESPKNPRKCSRLFIYEDIRYVLEEDTGTNNIEAIMIDLPKGDNKIHLSPEAFKKMKRLRFLKVRNVHFSGELDYLPNGIRVLDWREYPLQSMPPKFRGDELVILQMPFSLMQEIHDLEFKNLTVMNFEGCKFLMKISDLSGCPNLKEINISHCSKLIAVHDSIGLLDQLVEFDFSGCFNLKSFPKTFRLRSLKTLSGDFSGLQKFPEIECEMEHLSSIELDASAIEELPSSIEYLSGLTILRLSSCVNLKRLPSGITRMRSLKVLFLDDSPIISIGMEEEVNNGQSSTYIMSTREIEDSSSEELFPLQTSTDSTISFHHSSSSLSFPSLLDLKLTNNGLPKSNSFWPCLEELDLSGSDIQSIPACFKSFVRLRDLDLFDCKQLKEIIEFPPNLECIRAGGCISLDSLPESKIFHLPELWCIDLSDCYKLNMGNSLPIPAWNQGMMSFSGNKIPNWFSYCKEASNSRWCEFDIEVDPLYSDDIVGIAICAVIQPERTGHTCYSYVHKFYGGLFHHWDLDHHYVWLGYMKREHSDLYFGQDVDNLRITFESISNSVMFERCGVYLLYKKHEHNEKDLEGIGNLANPMDGGQLSKRRRVDSDHYDQDDNDDASCNVASNSSTQQMKTSATLAIKFSQQLSF